MGIRIHKCIGYGLTDVESEDCSIADDRFYEYGAMRYHETQLKDDYTEMDEVWTKEGFKKFCKSKKKELPSLWLWLDYQW